MHSKRTFVFGFLLVTLTLFLIKASSKNSCVTYFDYLLINFGGSCYYNPDVDLKVPEIIKRHAGEVQVYNVTTEDGYILTMFRIRRENPVGVILLQPPMSAGARAFLSDGSNSLGIALWKKGYEVWLSNHRGISYSRKHVNLSTTDSKFWDFGFHEIALYDLEAQFKIINNKTNSKITYIGYSVSSTEALIYASLKPNDAKKFIDSFILMAPLTVLKHFSSPFKYIFYYVEPFERFLKTGEFLTFEVVRWLVQLVNIVPYIVNIMSSVIMGWTPSEMDPVLYPFIFAHHGRGISDKMVYHYGQNFYNGSHFRMYDYGKELNRMTYSADIPPDYPLKNVNNPVYIIHGDRDKISTPEDIKMLCEELLPKKIVAGVFPIKNHNHIDFMFSKYRRKKTYSTIFAILNKIQIGNNSQ